MSGINVDVGASPSMIRSVAGYLDDLRDALLTADATLTSARIGAARVWEGPTSESYDSSALDTLKAADRAAATAKSQVEIIRAYAQQMQFRQEDLDELRERAINGGLVVLDATIKAPEAVPDYPALDAGYTAQELLNWQTGLAQHQAALVRVELFNEISVEAQEVFARINSWINEHMRAGNVDAFIIQVSKGLVGPDSVSDATVSTASSYAERYFKAEAAAVAAAAAVRAAARSGNPAVRAGATPPRPSAVESAIERSPVLTERTWRAAGGIRVSGAVGKFGGPLIAAGFGMYEISQGGSPSEVIVKSATGLAAGAAVGAAAVVLLGGGAIVAPVLAVGVGAATGAVAGQRAWNHCVSQETRDRIDEGFRDAYDLGVDGAQDVWAMILK